MFINLQIEPQLSRFTPITLDEMGKVRLMNPDRYKIYYKFDKLVTPSSVFWKRLPRAGSHGQAHRILPYHLL